MSYPLDVAKNGFKPLNGSEWGSKEAQKEIEENLAKAKEWADKMHAQYLGTKDAILEFAEANKEAILQAIGRGAQQAIDSFEEPQSVKSLMEMAKDALREQGYSDREIETMEASARIFAERAPWKNRGMN